MFFSSGQTELFKRWDAVRDDAHDDGVAATLLKDVDAETAVMRKTVRKIAGAGLFQSGESLLVGADQVRRHPGSMLGEQDRHALDLHRREMSADFNLRRATRGKDQIADALRAIHHGSNQRCG